MNNPFSCLLLLLFIVLLPGCESQTNQPAPSGALFTEITQQSRLTFVHEPAVEGDYFFPEINGSGGGFLDYDLDGDLDIYLLNGAYRNPEKGPVRNRLFRQEANGTFTEVTDASGLGDPGYSIGLAVGDIDNDGDPDVYVSNFGTDKLYRNNGNGTFTDISDIAGIRDSSWGTSVLFLDYDRDGFLDIYVETYVRWNPAVICTDRAGRKDYCGPLGYPGEPDILYHNNGNGTFTDVSELSGISRIPNKGLGVVSADFNSDGYPDVYVANDQEPNQLWINQKNGTFLDMGMALGVAVNGMGQPEASMGVALGDVDQDGILDLFMTHLTNETNTFYRGTGSAFQDETAATGLGNPSIPFTGFGTGFFDFDHDGDLDIAIVNGRVIRNPGQEPSPPDSYWDDYSQPNILFENDGNGRFLDRSKDAGTFATQIETSRGLAFGDVDNDGDTDLLVMNCGGPARLYRNDSPKKGNWITIRAANPSLHRDDTGALVTVIAGGRRYVRPVQPSYSYLSSNDPRIHVGILSQEGYDHIEVIWNDGLQETFPGGKADQFLTIAKGTSATHLSK